MVNRVGRARRYPAKEEQPISKTPMPFPVGSARCTGLVLARYFDPPLGENEPQVADLEGRILGVM